MKSHFHPRTLLFYGSAIILVTILFRVTALYGERHLKAPPNLNGSYLSPVALPGCPESSQFAIVIQQSGIYLNGFLQQQDQADSPSHSSTEQAPQLHGLWRQGQIALTGTTEALANCRSQAAVSPVDLQGQLTADGTTLSGQVAIGGMAQPLNFTAQRQAEAQPKTMDH